MYSIVYGFVTLLIMVFLVSNDSFSAEQFPTILTIIIMGCGIMHEIRKSREVQKDDKQEPGIYKE